MKTLHNLHNLGFKTAGFFSKKWKNINLDSRQIVFDTLDCNSECSFVLDEDSMRLYLHLRGMGTKESPRILKLGKLPVDYVEAVTFLSKLEVEILKMVQTMTFGELRKITSGIRLRSLLGIKEEVSAPEKQLILSSNTQFTGRMDKHVKPLCDSINALPFIETIESCDGHGKTPLSIWMHVKGGKEGLFFLTRCTDRRYWKYGHLWKLELSVGDQFIDNHLPISYHLHSGSVKGEKAYKQAKDLIDNMNYHLNHKNFMKGFKLGVNQFETKEVYKKFVNK